MRAYITFLSPVGTLTMVEDAGALTALHFGQIRPEGGREMETPLLKRTAGQLFEYFSGRRRVFDLPLAPRGTDFQVAVWKALQGIPYGETRFYKEIAEAVGNPKACRAVGMANSRNPLGIVIPCHRVIGANGKLTGFAGGLGIKEKLLQMEKRA